MQIQENYINDEYLEDGQNKRLNFHSCNDLRKVIELEITDLEKELNKTTWTARNPGLTPRALGSFYLPNQLEKLKEILEEWDECDKEGSGLKDKLKEKEIQEDELITFS